MIVSIFTPTKDRAEYLSRAAESVVAQSLPAWEWIVLDVGQTSAESVLPDDPRILYFREPPAQGPAEDFQRALMLTSGELVHPMGDDDMLPRNALEIAVSEIRDHEWLVGRTNLYNVDGTFWTTRGGSREFFDMTMAGEYMLGGAVYWRKRLSDRLGGFNARFTGAADVELYMRFGRDSTPRIIPDVLYHYFDHPGTDSNVNSKRQARQVQRIVENS